jgi:ABC-2 type transport system ATP-binding protein
MSSATDPPAIDVEALVKTYGEIEAVRGVSFTVARGEVFGFLGPNGAGKSTTINMLCTLARPTSGTARVNGFDVTRERDDVRRHIGLVRSAGGRSWPASAWAARRSRRARV